MYSIKGNMRLKLFKKFIRQRLTCNLVRRVDSTIVASCFAKDYLLTTWHIPENKVSPVYYGKTPLPIRSYTRPVPFLNAWEAAADKTVTVLRQARGQSKRRMGIDV